VRSASLTVRAGEIVCLAGLIGAGRTELCETLIGARPMTAGQVRVAGTRLAPRGVWDGKAAGLGMVPEDRKTSGLFPGMDIANNVAATVLGRVSNGAVFSRAKAEALAQHYVDELRIVTPGVRQLVGYLSGGNQQKVLIAKWLAAEPRVLIVDEPTRGVDVGARAEIYRLLRGLKARGVALLVVSSELPEVLALADRIVVMAEGRTVGELAAAGATEEAVLALATQFTASVAGGTGRLTA
jgi:ribose transport system ATP-binding protein/rhamnose transport system ATP-binding protein